jgi:hypothetical protein
MNLAMTATLYRDTRFGEKDRWIYRDPNDATMRMPEDQKKCLGFLVAKSTIAGVQHESYEGTAFFISVPSEQHAGSRYFYLVTAKHVITDAKGKVVPDLYLRLNTPQGGRVDVKIEGTWVFHKNRDIDVALLSINPPNPAEVDWRHCHYSLPGSDIVEERDNSFADATAIEEWGVGIGDELRVVGLFSKRVGNKQNIPVVRSGIIAAMPEEPVETTVNRFGKIVQVKFNAYLGEVRSIGGLSGSPVFVCVEHFRKPRPEGAGRPLLLGVGYRILLLGMIRGHWHYESQGSFITSAANRPKDVEQVNMGMALITPIQDVLDTLYDEEGELMKQRRKGDEEYTKQKGGITEDSTKAQREEPLTREAFTDALKQVSKKTSEPESKRSQTSE